MDLLEQINQRDQLEKEIENKKNWDISNINQKPEYNNMTIGEVYSSSPITADKKYPFNPELYNKTIQYDGLVGPALQEQKARQDAIYSVIGKQNLNPNFGNGRIKLKNKNYNPINKINIASPVENLTSEIISSTRNTNQIKPDYVAYSSGRIDDMSLVNVPAPIINPYEKIQIQKEAEANAAKFKADFVSGEDGIYRASNTGNAVISVGDVIDTTAEKVEPKPNIKALQTTIASNRATEVNINQPLKLQKMSNVPNVGPGFYNTNAIDNLQKMNRQAQIGKRAEEILSTPKTSSFRKYGAYALGALAATALVNTMFFGDKKGEQTNAQLYGQQPLY